VLSSFSLRDEAENIVNRRFILRDGSAIRPKAFNCS